MDSRQKKILFFVILAFVVVVTFALLFKYGLKLFIEDFDYI
jgi:hypothetical protein